MDVDELIDEVIGREGGYVNHPVDRGGPTRWGITGAAARAQGWCGDMRRFPRDEAVAIYRRLYWLRPGFDQVAEQAPALARSEEHTSELQSLMRISYAVFCLKKKTT